MKISKEQLLENLDRLHTTKLGAARVCENLGLDAEGAEDVVEWCRKHILSPGAVIVRRGKNWYVRAEGCVITVNAHSYTVITAHKAKGEVRADRGYG